MIDEETSEPTGIGSKLISGATWMVTLRIIDRMLGVVSILVLARLLVPDDFGVVAMGMSFVAVLEVLGELGLDIALIQRQEANEDLYHTAWTVRVGLAIFVALLLFLLRGQAAEFYSEPRLISIMPLLAFATMAQGFENIGVINFRKELMFGKEFQFQLIKRLVSIITTIVLAVIFRSYWALAIGVAMSRVVGVVLSYSMHSFRPRLRLKESGELFHFVKWLFFTRISNFINMRFADFVVGRAAGAGSLGAYRIAFEIAMMPTAYMVMPLNRVLLPSYSILAGKPEDLRRTFLSVMSIIVLLALPLGLGMAMVADLAIAVLLGENWASVGRLLESLSIFGLTVALVSNVGPAIVAIGKPRMETVLTVSYLVIFVPVLLMLSSSSGAIGAADAYAISGLSIIPINYWMVRRELGASYGSLLKIFLRPVVAVIVMLLGVNEIISLADSAIGFVRVAWLVVAIIGGAVIYVTVIAFLWVISGSKDGAERLILDQLQEAVRYSQNRLAVWKAGRVGPGH